MLDRKVRVTPHHCCRLPAAEFLENVQGRSALHIPGRPGMPQIVPAESSIPARLSAFSIGLPSLRSASRG
jgi:hypothetical protein